MSTIWDYKLKEEDFVKQQNGKNVSVEQILKAREMWLKTMKYEKHFGLCRIYLSKRKFEVRMISVLISSNQFVNPNYIYEITDVVDGKIKVFPEYKFDPTKLLSI